MQTLTIKNVAEIAERSVGSINQAVFRGDFAPFYKGGRGDSSRWSRADAVNALLYFRMIEAGINHQTAGKILNGAGRHFGKWAYAQQAANKPALLLVFEETPGEFWAARDMADGLERLQGSNDFENCRAFNLLALVDIVDRYADNI